METTKTLRKYGWLNFSGMVDLNDEHGLPSVLCGGRGIQVWDTRGRRFLDGLSGAFCVNVGYGRDRILEAAHTAAASIHFSSPFLAGNPWAIQLADALSHLAEPVVGSDARVFFVNSGSEAIEACLKISRAYAKRHGHTERHRFLSRKDSYHGTTFGALSTSGFEPMKEDYGPLLTGFTQVPHALCSRCMLGLHRDDCNLDCAGVLTQQLVRDDHDVAGVVLEPMQNCGGNIPSPEGYLQSVSDACKCAGVPLILDEVITGFGRLGNWFGAEHYGVHADIIACAKGLTSGYESLGAMIVRREIADVFIGRDDHAFHHGSTFGGRPSAAAAAMENLSILSEEHLLTNARERSSELRRLLDTKLRPLPMIGEIRGDGLLFGIDVRDIMNAQSPASPASMHAIHRRLLDSGLICCMRSTIQEPVIELAPPLIVTSDQLHDIVAMLHDTLVALYKEGIFNV